MYRFQPGQRAPEAERQQRGGMICGLSRDGRLYIFFDMPFALQIGNGVRWWWRGLTFFWRARITIVISVDRTETYLTCRIAKDEAGSPHPSGWG